MKKASEASGIRTRLSEGAQALLASDDGRVRREKCVRAVPGPEAAPGRGCRS